MSLLSVCASPLTSAPCTGHQNTMQMSKANSKVRKILSAGCCAAIKKRTFNLKEFIYYTASPVHFVLPIPFPSLFLSLSHSYIPSVCTRCQVPLFCLTTVVKAFTLDISGVWRNTDLSRAWLYFSSTPHSNSYQTQTQTHLITYSKHWKHTFSQTNVHF